MMKGKRTLTALISDMDTDRTARMAGVRPPPGTESISPADTIYWSKTIGGAEEFVKTLTSDPGILNKGPVGDANAAKMGGEAVGKSAESLAKVVGAYGYLSDFYNDAHEKYAEDNAKIALMEEVFKYIDLKNGKLKEDDKKFLGWDTATKIAVLSAVRGAVGLGGGVQEQMLTDLGLRRSVAGLETQGPGVVKDSLSTIMKVLKFFMPPTK